MVKGFSTIKVTDILIQDADVIKNLLENNWCANPYHTEHLRKYLKRNAFKTKVSGQYIRKIINYLRQNNIPICSSSKGYWWADDLKQLDDTIESLEQRANVILQAVNGLKRSRNSFVRVVQMELYDEATNTAT